jgi:MoxR-like ATPase
MPISPPVFLSGKAISKTHPQPNRMNAPPETEPTSAPDHLKAVEFCRESYANIQNELAKVVVGQGGVLEEILIAIFTRSHALLVGVPGLAKTLMISTLAQTLQMSFKRVQFTPDLMPSDITGTEVIYSDQTTGEKQFKFLPGPLFANIVLADEINRTPPKTQAAMYAAQAVLRARDAESAGAGGDLSAAGGAARPVHVFDQRRLSVA